MGLTRTWWRVGLAAATIGVGGCWFMVGAGVGAGALAGYEYLKGEGTKMYARDVPTVKAAAEAALRKMKIVIINSACDDLTGKIAARLTDDTAVSIRLKAEPENITKVNVRVGTMGDKTRTDMIFKEIDGQLGLK